MLVRCWFCHQRKYDETDCTLKVTGHGDRWASLNYGYMCPECIEKEKNKDFK